MIPRAEQSSVSKLDSWIFVFLSAFQFAPFAFGIIYKYYKYLFHLCSHSNLRLSSDQKPQPACDIVTVLSSEQAVDFSPPQPWLPVTLQPALQGLAPGVIAS